MSRESKYLLAFDGGGARGIYAARIICRIEQALGGNPIARYFETITGTSTGAILAGCVACEIPGPQIEACYQRLAGKIFRYRPWSLWGLLCSQYSHGVFVRELKALFGQTRLGEVPHRLTLPAMNLTKGEPVILRSDAPEHQDIPVWQAIHAACAAQSFFDPVHIGESYYCDGGLWAYDPTLCAVAESIQRGLTPDSLKVLSLGSGVSTQGYPTHEQNALTRLLGWGLGTRWRVQRLINLVLNLQKSANAKLLKEFASGAQVLRINFTSTKSLPLDNPRDIPFLLNQAEKDFQVERTRILDFLEK